MRYHWTVETERVTAQYGRLDIVVRCPQAGFLCVIENKINATEQDRQLVRYADWMTYQRSAYPRQALVYLTPGGWEVQQAEAPASYYTLSYRKDIASWLRNCLSVIVASHLRVVLRQYIDIIETL